LKSAIMSDPVCSTTEPIETNNTLPKSSKYKPSSRALVILTISLRQGQHANSELYS